MLSFLIKTQKTDLDSSEPYKASRGSELFEHLSKTHLDGVLSALPMSCRQIILESDGVLAQLAMIALLQSEKGKKKLHVARHEHKKNRQRVKLVVKKVKAELGALKKKLKRIKKKLKEEKTKKKVLGGHGGKRLKVRKKPKVIKKPSSYKKPKKLKGKLLRLIKLKKVKKQKVKQKVKVSSKGLSKLSKQLKVKKLKVGGPKKKGGASTKIKIKSILKKGKLPFLIKPDGKAMGKAAKKVYAKEKKQARLRLSLLEKKRERGKEDIANQYKSKVKVANAAFFKKASIKKTVTKDSPKQPKPQSKVEEDSRQSLSHKVSGFKNSA